MSLTKKHPFDLELQAEHAGLADVLTVSEAPQGSVLQPITVLPKHCLPAGGLTVSECTGWFAGVVAAVAPKGYSLLHYSRKYLPNMSLLHQAKSCSLALLSLLFCNQEINV